MSFRFFVVDDDVAVRRMLGSIIQQAKLGVVVGESGLAEEALLAICEKIADVVLVDLLLPDMDGIELIRHAKGKTDTLFVMISQVQAKEMVGEAYEAGIEFFIHKPINSVEVVSVLGRVCEFLRLRNTVNNVFRSLSEWGENTSPGKNKTFATDLGQKIRLILFDMGIAGEAGVRDLEEAGIFLVQNQLGEAFSIKELLVHLAGKSSPAQKAAEQRMRRAIQSAFRHLSAIGVEDYSNPRFESYASTFFDFVEIRKEMRRMETGKGDSGKVGLKRFIHALAHRASQE